MKTLKIYFVALSLLLLTIACSKEENALNQDPEKENSSFSVNDFPKTPNPIDAKCYTIYEEDPNFEKINEQILEIAIATRNYFKEFPDMKIVESEAKSNDKEAFNLQSFVLKSSSSFTDQTAAYNQLNNLLVNSDFTYQSNSTLRNETYNFFPAVYIPNLAIADFNKEPIICAAIEVNSSLPEMEEYEGYIVGWYYDENNNLNEILINEQEAMNTTHPVIIIVPDTENDKNSSQEDIHKINNKSTKTIVNKTIDEYKINYRYDSSNRSEYSYSVAYVFNNGGIQHGGYREEIAEIHKDDIGVLFTNDYAIWQISQMNDLYSVYFVTFEYDWFATKKNVYMDNVGVGCRMTNPGDYYQRLSIIMTDQTTISSEKGYIKVKTQ